jgi:predicted RNA binding protein YcfA (HicA-like mRNA interferase family)
VSPGLRPVARRELVRRLRALGFEGPFTGGKHQLMVRGTVTIRIPNPHGTDIGVELLARVLRQAGVDSEEWDRA